MEEVLTSCVRIDDHRWREPMARAAWLADTQR